MFTIVKYVFLYLLNFRKAGKIYGTDGNSNVNWIFKLNPLASSHHSCANDLMVNWLINQINGQLVNLSSTFECGRDDNLGGRTVPILDKVTMCTTNQPTPSSPYPPHLHFSFLTRVHQFIQNSENFRLHQVNWLWRSVYQRCKNIQLCRTQRAAANFSLFGEKFIFAVFPFTVDCQSCSHPFRIISHFSYSCFYRTCNFFPEYWNW